MVHIPCPRYNYCSLSILFHFLLTEKPVIIVTNGSLHESRKVVDAARMLRLLLYEAAINVARWQQRSEGSEVETRTYSCGCIICMLRAFTQMLT